MVARAWSRAHALSFSKKALRFWLLVHVHWTCCGVIYVHAAERLHDRCSARSFASYNTCVTLWQVANACRRVGIARFMHSTQVGSCGPEWGWTQRSVARFQEQNVNIATRTHRTDSSSSSGTTTEQVSTLHNATAYAEGIHFGSRFRHVNTHAPHTFLSCEIRLKNTTK